MTHNRRPALLLIIFFLNTLYADTLTVSRAVEIGLINNFSIRIARNESKKNRNNRMVGRGLMLPSLRLDGAAAKSRTSYYPPSPGTRSLPGTADEAKASVTLNWTLFDGFKMFYTAKQIEQRIEWNELAVRREIESAVVAIITAYHQLAARRAMLAAAQQQLNISRSQLSFVNTQYEYGRVGKRELLHQQVVFNTDSSQILTCRLDYTLSLHALNIAMGRSPDIPAEVIVDSSINCPEYDAEYWYYLALKYNTGLKMAEIEKLIAYTQHAITRAALWPMVAVSATASANIADPGDDILRNRAELSVSIPIFSGFSRITAVKNAAVDTLNEALETEQQKLKLRALVYEQWERLRATCSQIEFEKQAIDKARQALDLAVEQFRLGRISDIQLREAQLALLNAEVRMQSAMFQNKVVMLQLRQLAGRLTVNSEE